MTIEEEPFGPGPIDGWEPSPSAVQPRELPPPSRPLEVARLLARERFTDPYGVPVLRSWRDGWWQWIGPRWVEVERKALGAAAYEFAENAFYVDRGGNGRHPAPRRKWAPGRRKIDDVLHALEAIARLDERVAMPSWLDGTPNRGQLISCANGLLDVRTRELRGHAPAFWNETSVPFAYDPMPDLPICWHVFLEDIWPGDDASKAALQEVFGYVISGRLDLQVIVLLVGETRAGKGVIARLLRQLVGPENVAGPTLSSLGGEFGLSQLLGKPLAVIPDVRLSGRANTVVERLLSISGEDTLSVNRKNRPHWVGKLPTRLMLLSNEVPQLGDASQAIARRFLPFRFTRSWLGREDRNLEGRLHDELPGIFNWALDGLERLELQGRFTQPAGADDVWTTLAELASPVATFVRECCEQGPDLRVPVDQLYAAWQPWAEANGHGRKTKHVFGRDLRAVIPGLTNSRPREGDARTHIYVGVGLRHDGR
jgi:putative DNA primase/helicase